MANIIGDPHGKFKILMSLIEKMPSDEIIITGDMIDRGPDSAKVIEFASTTEGVRAIKGNHESFLLDFIDKTFSYEEGLWIFRNGGNKTIQSYGQTYGFNEDGNPKFPKEHIDFIRSLPLYIETDKFLITHAPIYFDWGLKKACEYAATDSGILWNRGRPSKRDKFQIFAHQGEFKKYGDFAICIDNSWNNSLMGINTNTMEIFEQTYE